MASLKDLLPIKYPIIMAPMFLVSNEKMLIAAANAGITGAIPALNWRTIDDMRKGFENLKRNCHGPFGINLIVNKSNIKYHDQLELACEMGVDYIITSLGNPKETIDKAHSKGIKVFCDVTDLKFGKKVESLGADAIIAVNKEAGGHAGPTPAAELVPLLVSECNIPIISAGGVGTSNQLKEKLDLGAIGCSIGSPFIATHESGVSEEYKQACIDYGAKDIVMTTKLSGTPCTVIETDYVKKIGTKQTWLETLLNKNRKLKKWVKMVVFVRGMKSLEKAAFSATYKTVWCAGPSIEHVHEIKSVKEVVDDLVKDLKDD